LCHTAQPFDHRIIPAAEPHRLPAFGIVLRVVSGPSAQTSRTLSSPLLVSRTRAEKCVKACTPHALRHARRSKVKGGLLMLRSCDVDAEITCRDLADIYKRG